MADLERKEQARQKAREKNEARKRAKRTEQKPHSKKGITTHAKPTTPKAAGRSVESKKKASHGEEGAHAGRPKAKRRGK